ncbi:Dienelactone hydrolase [Lishizhenia tianjinensis]|uniref:Dienelactone hydrolase n=1 Tax=Lishizhenia tianjinensis TaxID=477690 RepID=A0A1I6Y147_9FLAO|nr:dienelactone hydrolase family protein [Lishizhenia tianjinensis]SFT43961.1 Dienelactone hydrolase [Lishizhenia tianjinensis]
MKNAYKSIFVLLIMGSLMACKDEVKTENSENEDVSGVVKEDEERRLLVANELDYSSPTTDMKGYIVHSKLTEGRRPGIIVIHEWWGHNDYVRKRADMLADLGYTALAIDMYGNGKQAKHSLDAGSFSSEVMSNMPVAKARFEAALEALKKDPTVDTNNIAVIGYCFGGSVALTMADAGYNLKGAAAFHSGVKLPIMPNDQLKARILVCNGADDPFIKNEDVVTYKSALDSLDVDYKYIEYPGATHGFTSKASDSLGKKFDLPLAYNLDADEQSWEELKSMLKLSFQ